MASKIYNQEVIFQSGLTTKVVTVTLERCLTPVWIPLLITERKARTALLHLYLSTGVEGSTPITLTVPLFVGLSSDVTDYTCETLFQGNLFCRCISSSPFYIHCERPVLGCFRQWTLEAIQSNQSDQKCSIRGPDVFHSKGSAEVVSLCYKDI